MLTGDEALAWIAYMAGVSKPRARAVLQVAREIELENRMEKIAHPPGRPQCRLVGGCTVIAFPSARIVRQPEPPEAA